MVIFKVGIVEETRKMWITELRRDQFRIKDVKDFTYILLEKIRQDKASAIPIENTRRYGKIVHIGLDRNGLVYGFIRSTSSTEDIFFHSRQSPNVDFFDKKYFNISYDAEKNPVQGSNIAVNIKILSDSNTEIRKTADDSTVYRPFAVLIKNKDGA